MHSRPQKTLFTNQSHKNSLNFVYNGDCKAPHDYNWTIQALYQLHVLLIIKSVKFFYAGSCYYNVWLQCINCSQNKTGGLLCIPFTFISQNYPVKLKPYIGEKFFFFQLLYNRLLLIVIIIMMALSTTCFSRKVVFLL